MWHKWVLYLSYPKLHIQAIEVGSWGSLKAFGEVTNTTWAIEGSIRGTLSFFAKFSKTAREVPEKESKRCKVKTPYTFQPLKARWKAKSPTSKVRLSFSHTNLFEFVRRAWSLCAGTCRVITPCNPWSTESKSRLCSRTRKRLTWGSLLTVLTTKIWPSKPRVWEEYTTSFKHIFDTNKVPRVVLQFLWTGTHLGGKWKQCATRATHGRTTRHDRPCRYGRPCRCGWPC
jgi:hypothetical protein